MCKHVFRINIIFYFIFMLFYCRSLLFCALENVSDGRVAFVGSLFSMVGILCSHGNAKTRHVDYVMESV